MVEDSDGIENRIGAMLFVHGCRRIWNAAYCCALNGFPG